ncbi:hypothetical protein BWQ96_04685 [Gracilariopsis chorda]|uniref:Uncharacterized protein n=1 Tax=Gracilariopsis chorda TaxID=448386 RepID=A0A2V3IV16_9FLOR|nr:hypothetical protein BWQ96_04685 [Gracilariopsis chorda]|eukprot:PXF45547.1 hypothetical protein BWQ96_04685 [Gracilariopsis chorda]
MVASVLGTSAEVDWVADVEIDAAIEAGIRASRELKQRVTAHIILPRFNWKDLLPSEKGTW